jgi:uncharacterized membrane protein YfcA
MVWDFGLVGASAVVGILVGLTGVGAGAAMTPLLVGFFGVPIPTAIATDLLFATITKSVGVATHGTSSRVNWKLARQLWSGSIPSVTLGSLFLVGLVAAGHTSWLTWLLLAFVAFTSYTLITRAINPATSHKRSHARPAPRWLAPLGGAGLGLGVSLTSVGAGVLGMALMVRLSPSNTEPRTLVATDLLHAIPIALIAGVSYSFSGLLDGQLLTQLLVGSIPGVVAGAYLSKFVPGRALNLVLGLVLAVLAVSLVIGKSG